MTFIDGTEVRAVLQEMRDRQVARRFKSQTLTDWADRIESALSQQPAAVDGAMVEVASLPALWMREADEIDRLGYVVNSNSIRARATELERALAAGDVQAGEAKAEVRELLDARVIDSLINANEEIHAAAVELATCLTEAVAAGAMDTPLTYRAGMALKMYESLTELAPKDEARGGVRHDLCDCPNGRAEHSPSCADLTGERNV